MCSGKANADQPFVTELLIFFLVSWCFEPSQPQRIISGLNTNLNPSPSHPLHKSLHHKSLFLKPQLKFYPQFRNSHPEKHNTFGNLFIFREHSTREPASYQKKKKKKKEKEKKTKTHLFAHAVV